MDKDWSLANFWFKVFKRIIVILALTVVMYIVTGVIGITIKEKLAENRKKKKKEREKSEVYIPVSKNNNQELIK